MNHITDVNVASCDYLNIETLVLKNVISKEAYTNYLLWKTRNNIRNANIATNQLYIPKIFGTTLQDVEIELVSNRLRKILPLNNRIQILSFDGSTRLLVQHNDDIGWVQSALVRQEVFVSISY
jgi:hypothetical protein